MTTRSFNDYIDEQYPPGSPERASFDAYGDALAKRRARVSALTGWLRFIPPRWQYAEPDVIDGVTYRYYHGVGHIAMCFWSDILDALLEESDGRSPARRAKSAVYSALDGLAFHYLDDAYVPTLTDVRAGRAGACIGSWRRRRKEAIERAVAAFAELRASGDLDPEPMKETI